MARQRSTSTRVLELAVAVEGGGALMDADDGADAGLQMAVVENDALAETEVCAGRKNQHGSGRGVWYELK